MKRFIDFSDVQGIFVDDDGTEYTHRNGKRVVFTEEMAKEDAEQHVLHYFNSRYTALLDAHFDDQIMFVEHIPDLEFSYAIPSFGLSYPIKEQGKNGGYVYKDLMDDVHLFILLPEAPSAKKNIARLEFAIHAYICKLQKGFKMHYYPDFFQYDPKFNVYENGILTIDYLFLMTASEYCKFFKDHCCHLSWDIIDDLQAICEKFGYALK